MTPSPSDLAKTFEILRFDPGTVPPQYVESMRNFFFFEYHHLEQRSFFLAVQENRVIGLLKYVEQSGYVNNAVGLATIETDKEVRKLGIASALASALMKHTAHQNKRLRVSSPENNPAAIHFQTTLARLAQDHHIELIRPYE